MAPNELEIATVSPADAGIDLIETKIQSNISSITELANTPDINTLKKAGKVVLDKYKEEAPRTVEEYLLSVKHLMRKIRYERIELDVNDPYYRQKARKALKHSLEPIKTNEPNETWKWMWENRHALNEIIQHDRDDVLTYQGVNALMKSYLLHEKYNGRLVESPQFLFLRVASQLHYPDLEAVKNSYLDRSIFKFIDASPTLFNAGLTINQMSSCFLLTAYEDSLYAIRNTLDSLMAISKTHGAVGISFRHLRTHSPIGVTGLSQGTMPIAKIADEEIQYVNQGGQRPGAGQVTQSFEHLDILEHIEATRKIGAEDRRLKKLDTVVAFRDIFFERYKNNEDITLFCPSEVDLTHLYGEEFTKAYIEAEKSGKGRKRVPARKLLEEVAISLLQSGRPYCINVDTINLKSNMQNVGVIESLNLCQEIALPADEQRIPSCNLASICLLSYVDENGFNWKELSRVVREVVKNLNQVIRRNYYTLPEIEFANRETAPIGIGFQGAFDALCKLDIAYETDEATRWEAIVCACTLYNGLLESVEEAKKYGAYEKFRGSPLSNGIFQHDMWQVEAKRLGLPPIEIIEPSAWGQEGSWEELRQLIMTHGVYNSQITTSQPTAGVTQITCQSESWEPRYSNIFVRETKAGNFIEINPVLQERLEKIGLWHDETIAWIRMNHGSVQGLSNQIDADPNTLKEVKRIEEIFKTVFEVKQRSILDKAAARGPYIDASQSTNIYLQAPSVKKVMNVIEYANEKRLKTLIYYLRTKAASNASQWILEAPKSKIKPSFLNRTVSSSSDSSEGLVCTRQAGCLSCQ